MNQLLKIIEVFDKTFPIAKQLDISEYDLMMTLFGLAKEANRKKHLDDLYIKLTKN